MAFFAGKSATMTVGASAQPMTDWTLDIKEEAIDVTNFTSSGYQESVGGINAADITCTGPYDGTSGVTMGTAASFILATGGGGTSFTVPARVTSVNVATSVRGVATISITAQSTGTFTVTP
jgi:hypothetical protein